jgi:hypothetical protein
MARLSAIGIGKHARALAAALALGAVVISASAGQAHAMANDYVCWIHNGEDADDEWEALLPGEVIHDGPLTMVCMGGYDDNWWIYPTPRP